MVFSICFFGLHSSETGTKSFEYAFSTLSFSSSVGANRPPALSSSSISSLGEETAQNKLSAENCYSSPITLSFTRKQSAIGQKRTTLSSPIVGKNDDSRSINNFFTDLSPTPVSFEDEVSSKNDLLSRGIIRKDSNSNIGFNDLSNKPDDTPWSPNNVSGKVHINPVKSDVTDDTVSSWTQHDNLLLSPSNTV